MITNIKEFTDKLSSGKIKKINENYFEEDELIDSTDETNDDIETETDITEEDTTMSEPTITFDTLKDALLTKFNDLSSDIDGDGAVDTVETPIMLSDEQLQIVFDTLVEMGVVPTETETEVEDTTDEFVDETETDETTEDTVEEAFGFAKKIAGEDDAAVEKRKEILISKLEKVAGKGILLVNGETKESVEINNAAEAIEAIAGDNNYNGMIIPKAINFKDKTAFVYKPGKKGIEKFATGGASGGLGV